MKAIWKEPLVHFALAAVFIFAAYGSLAKPTGEQHIIEVSEADLLRYLQYRSKNFDGERFQKLYASLSADELQGLMNDYAREEALYREAKAMQLDRNDYVARLRLVQQLEYLTRGTVATEIAADEHAIRGFYEKNRSSYYVEPTLSFTHVFISKKNRSADEQVRLTKDIGDVLRKDGVPASKNGAYGDRFIYHLNYADKPQSELAGHFGDTMAKKLFELEVDEQRWQGPIESDHGSHYILLTGKKGNFQPTFDELRSRVAEEYRQSVLEERYAEALHAVVKRYELRPTFSLVGKGDKP